MKRYYRYLLGIFLIGSFGCKTIPMENHSEKIIKGKVLKNYPNQVSNDGINYFVMTDDGKRNIRIQYNLFDAIRCEGAYMANMEVPCKGKIGPAATLAAGDSVEVFGKSIMTPDDKKFYESAYDDIITVCTAAEYYVKSSR
jgi:hypothetical protein